ncbi:MAG: sensor histidine kinase [Candidatus Binataceae bacterium]
MPAANQHGAPPKRRRDLSRLKWWCVALGVALGLTDTLLLASFGIRFELGGRDVTLYAAAWFSTSFAILGFLLGDAIDGRQRARESAKLIGAQMEELERSRARLLQSEKLAALGQLAAAIAHEVRNPLAVMRSAAQSLAETMPASDDRARRTCSFIIAETDRLENLVTALLAFARPVRVAPRAVSVSELFDRALELARGDLARKRVRIVRDGGGETALVNADLELIAQVIVGLLSNAIEAIADTGAIALEARTRPDIVEIAVEDSGPGIPPELRARVFDPFFTTRAKGVGLGLAIARQIVQAHSGAIDVTDGASGGARFRIVLPAAARAEAAA